MLYSEYLRCAEKHLKFCKAFLDSYKSDVNNDLEVFMELFYITGYVMEGSLFILRIKSMDGHQTSESMT